MKAFWPAVWTIVGLLVLGEVGFLVHSGLLTRLFSQASTQTTPVSAHEHCAPDTEFLKPGTFRPASVEARLFEAIRSDDVNRTKAIVRSLNKVPRSGPTGVSMLDYALTTRNKEIVDTLISAGADPRYRGCGEIAMNTLAAGSGPYPARPSVPIAEILLAHGAPLTNEAEAVAPSNRNEPLVTAAIYGDTDLVRWLYQHGAQINAKDFRGATPLLATMIEYDDLAPSRKYQVVDLLLSLGADPTARQPTFGSALHLAVESGDTEIVKLLLAHRADVSARDAKGRTPLQYAEFLQTHPTEQGNTESNKLGAIVALLK